MNQLINRIPTHFLVASSSWLSKGIVSVLQVYLVKILIELLGIDNYAVFSVIIGTIGWFALLDFGISPTIQNYISRCRVNNEEYQHYVDIVLIFVLILNIVLIVLFYFISPYIANFLLSKFEFISYETKKRLIFIAGTLFIITNLSSIVYRIWYAEMKGYLSNILPACGYIITFILIYFLHRDKSVNSLLYSVVCYLLPNALISLVVIFVTLKKFSFDGIIKKFSFIKETFKKSFEFWFFAIMASFVLSIDNVIAARFLKTEDIVKYNLLVRFFLFGYFVYASFLTAVWPIFSERLNLKEIDYVTKSLKKYIFGGIVYILIFTFFILLFKDYLIKFFLKDKNITIDKSLFFLFCFYYMVRVWCDTYAVILQSVGFMKPFLILVPLQAFFSIIFQIILVEIIGVYGIILGLTFSFIFTVAWGLPYYVNKYITVKIEENYGN